jgi:hypothetical protein
LGEEMYRIYINSSYATTDLDKQTGAGELQDDGEETTFCPFVINATKGGDSDNFFDYLNIG